MDFSESRRSLAKSLPRFFETELEPCDAVIEDEGDELSKGLDAIRACGLFGSETLKPAAGSDARFARFEPGGHLRILGAARACDMLLSSSRSDNAISINRGGKLWPRKATWRFYST